MGRFESKNVTGEKYYDALSKKTFGQIMSLDRFLSLYSFEPEGASRIIETYYDTPGKLLERAGLTLSKVVEGNNAYFKVEREYVTSSLPSIHRREEKVFIHDIQPNDDVKKHMYYIIDGITSMYTTSFNIDLENVLKTVVPKMEIMTRYNQIKVFSGNGFKAHMDFEDVLFKNYENKKSVPRLMVKVSMTSPQTFIKTFEDFNKEIQRYCKTIFDVKETKYQLAVRLTKNIK